MQRLPTGSSSKNDSGSENMSGSNASVDQQAVANAFRLRRANQLAKSKGKWERRRDPKTGQMRWFNDTVIDVQGACAAADTTNPSTLNTPSPSSERAFVRQMSDDGVLSWVPASEATVSSGVEGTLIDSRDLEGAASLPLDKKITWFQNTIAKLRTNRTDGVVKISVRRTHILEDTFQVFRNMERNDFKRALFFEFRGEKGELLSTGIL